MEDLPLGRIAALVSQFAVMDLLLGITLMMMIWGLCIVPETLDMNENKCFGIC